MRKEDDGIGSSRSGGDEDGKELAATPSGAIPAAPLANDTPPAGECCYYLFLLFTFLNFWFFWGGKKQRCSRPSLSHSQPHPHGVRLPRRRARQPSASQPAGPLPPRQNRITWV
jgi:hypothetical protein